MPVQKGHKFGPQTPEHVAKRFAAGAGAQKGKKQSPEAAKAAADARRGQKRAYSPIKAEITQQKWADGLYDDYFKRSARFLYGDVAMRSNWERLAAAYFDELGLCWEHEPRKFRLPTGQYYWPDFYLPDFDLWVEVKGYCTHAALMKFDLFVGLGHHAIFVTGETEVEFAEALRYSVAVQTGDVTIADTVL